MGVLIPRARTLGVRLSEEEYAAFERFCAENGARSLSDQARGAILSVLAPSDHQHGLALAVSRNTTQVMELERRVETLTAALAALKGSGRGRSKRARPASR